MSDLKKPRIRIIKDGPYAVTGNVPLKKKVIQPQGHTLVMEDGEAFPQQENYMLCRCGHSQNAPYCDGAHQHHHFRGAETASRAKFTDRAELQRGPALDLLDDNRCAFARFCHKEGGSVWELIDASDDPQLHQQAIDAASDCPAGRLVALYKNGAMIEPDYEPAIAILEDPQKGVSAGLFVMGGIPMEAADGTEYEVRNRMALCRCGHSRNKPFCDAMHVPADFDDGLED